MRLAVVVLAVMAATGSAVAGSRPGGEGQRSWWDVGPGRLVENDFALGIMYSPVCVSLARVEQGPASRAAFAMWREARPGAGSPLPGGAPCSYGVGVRLEGVHWFAPLIAFRGAVEGAWSWDLEAFPAPARTWRFRRYGVDLGVRFGRALGFVRPWADVGLVLGAASHFVERPALVVAAEPVFDPGYPAVAELLTLTRRRFGAAAMVGAGVDVGGPRYGVRFAVRRARAVLGPGFGSEYLEGAGFAWEVGPVIRF